MRIVFRSVSTALCIGLLAGCATPRPDPIAAAPPVAPIAVSCVIDAMSEAPCIEQARASCASPQVNTIHLVLATPVTLGVDQHTKTSYRYQATYTCDHSMASLAPR